MLLQSFDGIWKRKFPILKENILHGDRMFMLDVNVCLMAIKRTELTT